MRVRFKNKWQGPTRPEQLIKKRAIDRGFSGRRFRRDEVYDVPEWYREMLPHGVEILDDNGQVFERVVITRVPDPNDKRFPDNPDGRRQVAHREFVRVNEPVADEPKPTEEDELRKHDPNAGVADDINEAHRMADEQIAKDKEAREKARAELLAGEEKPKRKPGRPRKNQGN